MDSQSIENLVRRAAISYYIGRDQRTGLEQAAKWLIDAILAESGTTADSQYLEDLMILQDKIRKIMSQSKCQPVL